MNLRHTTILFAAVAAMALAACGGGSNGGDNTAATPDPEPSPVPAPAPPSPTPPPPPPAPPPPPSSAASCAGLRSGNYVAVDQSATNGSRIAMLSIDATTLAVTGARTAQLIDEGGCAYSLSRNGVAASKVLVSSSGIAIVRDTISSGSNAGRVTTSLLLPMQSVPTSELAGNWNVMDYSRSRDIDPYVATRFTYVFDANGVARSGTACANDGTCEPLDLSVTGALVAHPDGGWTTLEGGVAVGRAFTVKAADGHLSMFFMIDGEPGLRLATREAPVTLPTVGSSVRVWDYVIDSTGFAAALNEYSYTNTAVDAGAGTVTRLRTTDNRTDTLRLNAPQTGMRSRAANACTTGGVASACSGIHVMSLPGLGVAAYMGIAPSTFFGLAVTRP